MQNPFFRNRSKTDLAVAIIPSAALLLAAILIAYRYVDPAPPHRIVISTGHGEGDYQEYAKRYQELIKDDGIEVVIRPSAGAAENLRRLADPKSDIDVAFVQDGLGSAEKAPDLVSLGSLYYEPLWIFYRGTKPLSRLAQLKGLRIAAGREESGARALALKILKAAGVTEQTARLEAIGEQGAADALKAGRVDAALFIATPDDELVHDLASTKNISLMSLEQAEAISRHLPYLHHLVLPRGAFDLQRSVPERDIDLVSPTATLVAKDSLHPALVYLLLKAASQVHSDPGIFEKKNEFPSEKDNEFPLSDEAAHYYKSGVPFWQRHLPFWLATLVDRFMIVVLPLLAIVLPLVRLVPQVYQWRVRTRIYQRYGELKFLETQMGQAAPGRRPELLRQLDEIEERVNGMKIPLDHTEYVYALRQNIEFVRTRLLRTQT